MSNIEQENTCNNNNNNNNKQYRDYTDFNYGKHKIDMAKLITRRDPMTRNFQKLVEELYKLYNWSLCDIDILLHQLYTEFKNVNDRERCNELQYEINKIDELYKEDSSNNYYMRMVPPLLQEINSISNNTYMIPPLFEQNNDTYYDIYNNFTALIEEKVERIEEQDIKNVEEKEFEVKTETF
jgi:hypothetical protein